MKLETERLILRQWKDSDLKVFARLNSCEKVMRYFPKPLTQLESDKLAQTLSELITKNSWGVWALEEKNSREFIGFTGLKPTPDYLKFSPSIEVLWRLDSKYWHKGYATEAAKKSLEFAFNTIQVKSVVSYTSTINTPSQKVMQRIGMVNTGLTFQHPMIDNDHSLSQHVLYKATN